MNRSMYAQILEHLSTAILLLDDDLTVRYLNPAAEMLFGVSASRIKGLALNEVIVCRGKSLQDRLYEYLLDGRPYTERETKILLPNNHTITVNCTVSPILDSALAPAALLEIVQLDRLLRITREERRLVQHMATRAMVRGVAHEIKNPLGGLRGAAQLLESELEKEDLKEYTRIIIKEADRLRTLVDRMLGPNDPPKKRDVDIHDVLEHVRNLVKAEAPDGIKFTRDYDPSIPKLHADRDQLTQAVLNIVRNALQAIGSHGMITFKTRIMNKFTIGHNRHRLVIKTDIIDNGPGISDKILEKLFYPMVTGRERGSGLGLSIAQTLINQHHGLIECQSRPGRTEFNILLPIESPSSENKHA